MPCASPYDRRLVRKWNVGLEGANARPAEVRPDSEPVDAPARAGRDIGFTVGFARADTQAHADAAHALRSAAESEELVEVHPVGALRRRVDEVGARAELARHSECEVDRVFGGDVE